VIFRTDQSRALGQHTFYSTDYLPHSAFQNSTPTLFRPS